jgi:phage terminase large subunit GpA-like protein
VTVEGRGLASVDAVVARALQAWRPPERLSLSAWADRFFYLSPEAAAEPGPWKTLPYQREILDSITDPDVTQVTLMKSARVGYTLMLSAAIGYYMHHEPSSVMVVQPTVDDAKNFGKETIATMLRDVPVLARIMLRDVAGGGRGPKDSSDTLTHKAFPGGILSLVGANSGAGFRRVSRRVVLFDEVDAYPPSAGSDGDQIRLGIKRTEAFYNRKIVAGSTPLVAGASRIEAIFEAGDQRRYHVPCPHCGHMDFLSFREREDGRGHFMRWDEGEPESAHFICRGSGCVIEHRHKRWMVERGQWRADRPGDGAHRSYHIWTAYSYAANATWAHIASEFLEAKHAGVEALKTFVNTTLGETWQDRGEAPDWERLYARREDYPIGTVPAGVVVVTAGVDVQRDSLRYEVVGWARSKESWSIDAGILPGDTSLDATWQQLAALLERSFPGSDSSTWSIAMLAVDSGYNTQQVYNWARRYPMSRVIAVKGVEARALIGAPSPVDVTVSGRRLRRGYKVWPVGASIAKSELYGWLRLPLVPDGVEPPSGYCHFPKHGDEYFRQLTAEHLVTIAKRSGFTALEWRLQPGRENHYLDCRVYARAAAAVLGIDRIVAPPSSPRAATKKPAPAPVTDTSPRARRGGERKGWLGDGRGWLGRRPR